MVKQRKRSASLRLTTMLAGAASVTLAACEDRRGASNEWSDPIPGGEPVRAFSYFSLGDCEVANEVADTECRAAWSAARADHASHPPVFADRADCEWEHGAGACEPRTYGASSLFSPRQTAFVIGQMADDQGRPYYRGTALYRQAEHKGGAYASGWGGFMTQEYATGHAVIAREAVEPPAALKSAPPRIRASSFASRGGFGSGRGYAGG